MTKRKAIRALRNQKKRLNKSFQFGDSIWLGSTLHYVELIFAKDSNPYKALSQFQPFSVQNAKHAYPLVQEKLNSLIDNWIEMIKIGAHAMPVKKNFLYRLSDSWLIAIFCTVIPSVFCAGLEVGTLIEKYKKQGTPSVHIRKADSTRMKQGSALRLENAIKK